MDLFKKFFSHISSFKVLLVSMPVSDKVLDPKKTEDLLRALLYARIPFTLEVAVENIGNHLKFFIAIPPHAENLVTKTMKKLWQSVELEPHREGIIFASNGVLEGAYLTQVNTQYTAGDSAFLTALHNFSKLELVEEGIALQVVCSPSDDQEKLQTNVRLIATASTPFRTKDLIANVMKTFPGWNMTRVKNDEFISQFSHREFNEKQSLQLTPQEIINIFYY